MISPRGGSPIVSNEPSRRLVLASESPRRKALLAQVGIVPGEVRAAAIDESVLKGELPRAHALRLACEKARTVAQRNIGEFVLAADTVVSCGRRILPKAEDGVMVHRCLELLSGRQHRVTTAVALITPTGELKTRVAETRVVFRGLTVAEMDAYVDSREGEGKAGGYAIQGYAELFVRRINGSYSNVVGLPLSETTLLLRGSGFGC